MGWRWVVVGVAVFVSGCGESVAELGGELPFEPDTGLLVVDGDLPAETLEEAKLLLADPDPATTVTQDLTVAQHAGRDDVWSRTARQHLSYCVDRQSFGRAATAVVEAMRVATADWEASANVHFVHDTTEDAACSRTNGRVVFDVRRVSGRSYLARSFLPSQARGSREVLVDETSLPPPSPLTLAGVLRHELGHVLGLRHEHTRVWNNPCFEDTNWRAVTPYDVRSVMHYPQCAGVSGHDLVLSALDRRGIALLYP